MKEKLKNFFKDKKLWSSFIELLATILIVFISFFSGFSYGVTIDDDIRDEFIADCFPVSNTEQSSLNIEIDKKELKTNQYEYIAIPYGSNVTDSIVFDVSYIVEQCKVYYSDIVSSNILTGSQSAYLCSSLSFYDDKVYGNIFYFQRNTSSGVWNFRTLLLNGNSFSISNGDITILNASSVATICAVTSNGVTSINNHFLSCYFIDSFYNFFNSYNFGLYNLQLFDLFEIGCFLLPDTTDAYNNGYENGFNAYPNSQEYEDALNNAFQLGNKIGYESGVIEGVTQFKLSQEFKDILNNEYQEGINKGKDIRDEEYAQTDTVFTKIWTFLRDTISTTLSIFNIQIMPGIPLYFIVVIPIVIGLILWLFKLLQR